MDKSAGALLRFLPALLAVVSGLLLFLFPFDSFNNAKTGTVVKILVTIGVYLLSDTLLRHANHDATIDKIDERSDELLGAATTNFSVTYVGRSAEANKIVTDKVVGSARQVRNTIISSDIKFVSREKNEAETGAAYSAMLSRSDVNNWYDIVSKELVDLPRYSFVDETKQGSGQLKRYVLRGETSLPTMNFILIEYPSGEEEVYFGWLFSADEGLSSIFQSSDERLVRLFDSYFKTLQHSCQSD